MKPLPVAVSFPMNCKAYMEEKMRDKENSSPVTRLELPMTPRPQHH